MRTEFLPVKTAAQARKQAPWAAVVHKAGGGYMAFESIEDYQRWKSQK